MFDEHGFRAFVLWQAYRLGGNDRRRNAAAPTDGVLTRLARYFAVKLMRQRRDRHG